VRLINRTIGAERAGLAFSDLADELIAAMLDTVRAEFAKRHGEVAGSRLCVLGMGRLGSRELNAGSDLDLILLYDHDPAIEQSNGRKPLPVALYFLRLAQRMISAMSAPTGEGVLYALDFRLRPSGNAGPLATHIDAFADYQAKEAWTWERQALTRARVVAGDDELAKRIEAEIASAIALPVEADKLRADVCEMRALIDREKPTDNPLEVKTVAGGLTDIEFIAQWIVLSAGHRPTDGTPGAIAAMLAIAPAGTFAAGEIEILLEAHDLYSRLLQIVRLCTDDTVDAKAMSSGLNRMVCLALDLPDLATVVAQLRNQQKAVRSIFERLLGKIPRSSDEGKRAGAGLHRG
jgi:glutamate-ammonia-ligase adenylyltransferase